MIDEYYYVEPGKEEFNGPISLEAIRAAVGVGRLPANVMVSKGGDDEWIPLKGAGKGSANPLPAMLLRPRGSSQTSLAHSKKRPNTEKPTRLERSFVGGGIGIIGIVEVVGGILILASAFLTGCGSGGDFAAASIQITVGSVVFVNGLLFLAVAEVLKHLANISLAVRTLAERE